MVDAEDGFEVPMETYELDKTVEKQEFDVKINVLGLRDLESIGLLPI